MEIKIKNLHIRLIVGCQERERKKKQNIRINIILFTEDETAVSSDRLTDSIDYEKLTQKIVKSVAKTKFFLLEKLAGYIAEIILQEPRVENVVVEVDKPHALRYADAVSVTLSRSRN